MNANHKRNKNNEKLKKKYEDFFKIYDDILTIDENYHNNCFDKKIIDCNENELTEINNKKLKGVSKVVVKNDIQHEDYINVLNTNKPKKCNVVSIRSFNHELFTILQNKTALTNSYDKMKMNNGNECVPFGYMVD